MPNPADLERRLRSAVRDDPDTEGALREVMSRVRRRALWRISVAVSASAAVLAVVIVWAIDREGPEESTLLVGEPPTTMLEDSLEPVGLRERWRVENVAMAAGVASDGRPVVMSDELVFTATGFAIGETDIWGGISALDRATGEARWTVELGEAAFLQGVAGGIVVANTPGGERILGLRTADGSVAWEVSFAEEGLDGYRAVRSVVTTPVSAIGVSANNEGDVRPPVVLGVRTDSGDVAWTTDLADGTDLMWGNPSAVDGEVVFASTPSHPGSAPENVAHLVELGDGAVRWAAGMGGSQGFSDHAAAIARAHVHLPAHPDIVTVDRGDGGRRWARRGYSPLAMGDRLWMITGDGRSLSALDIITGEVVSSVDAPMTNPWMLIDLGGGVVGVVSRTELAAINRAGSVAFRQVWSGSLTDTPVVGGDMVVVATDDRAVTAYTL
jgi:outer membrane protein assembly factor BamB